jgi:bacterioferritin-associated ferredoxin
VVAVLEAGRSAFRPGMVAKAWRHRGLLTDGARYRLGLLEAGIPVKYNHTVFQAHGNSALRSVTYGPVSASDWQPDLCRQQRVDVDLLVVGFGFVPSTELCELAGCRTEYRPQLGGWVPARDAMMRTTVDGIFAAGDGSGVAGVLVAVEEGRVAGITVAEEAGAVSSDEAHRRRREPLRRIRSLAGVRAALDEISAVRPGLSQLATDRTVVCRCEEVTKAEVSAAVQEGARDLQSVKLLCRLGMGACQGRNCAPSVAQLLSADTGRPAAEAGRINPRPPVRPVTMATLACHHREESA